MHFNELLTALYDINLDEHFNYTLTICVRFLTNVNLIKADVELRVTNYVLFANRNSFPKHSKCVR